MSYFTIRKQFLMPSFDLSLKEQKKLDRFLLMLEKSGVGELLSKCHSGQPQNGGRPPFNRYDLLATVIYGFAMKNPTLRELESSCKFDLRYIYLMQQQRPTFMTFCTFINDYIVPNQEEIFSKIIMEILKECNIDLVDAFIDGTKIEADANKYKFVWKPTTWHIKLCNKIRSLLKSLNLDRNVPEDGIFSSQIIANKIISLSKLLNDSPDSQAKLLSKKYNQLVIYLEKALEYEDKESICGLNRNSYYKTDHDATAMCLKEDYYSGLGSNMHAGYNAQIVVIKGFICTYYLSQSRSDIKDFVPTIQKFNKIYGCYPTRICADSGYGSLTNYRFVASNNIGNYIKFRSWQGDVSGKYPDSYNLNDDLTITCLNGNIGRKIEIVGRHPTKAEAVFYRIDGCHNCSFCLYCKKQMKNQDEDFRIFEVVVEFQKYKNQAKENLLSPKGIEMRVNRSIQNEGAFGTLKQDMNNSRFRRISLSKTTTEFMLNVLGYDVGKLLRFFDGYKELKYWIAPDNLKAEIFKKPRAKCLCKRARKAIQKRLHYT